jgi:ribosomal protein S18 acetylase RimI-like enzyme
MNLIARLQAYYNSIAASQPDSRAPIVKPLPPADPTLSPTAELLHTAILACTPATFRPSAHVPGLEFTVLSDQSTIAEIQEGLNANALGFDPAAALATEAEALAFRAELIASRAFTAKLGGRPVGAGMFTPPIEGIAELAGITTLAPYRERGIGAAVTSEIAQVAFAHGVGTAILRTDNPVAFRVYQRIGFRPVASLEEQRSDE